VGDMESKTGKGLIIGKEEMKMLASSRLEARKPASDNNRPGTAYKKARREVLVERVRVEHGE